MNNIDKEGVSITAKKSPDRQLMINRYITVHSRKWSMSQIRVYF